MRPVKIPAIFKILKSQNLHAPVAELISIQTNNPEKILLATILSARTKDATTAAASKRLFSRINKIQDLENI